MTAHRVVFLTFDGVTHLDVAGPAEVFAEARELGADYALEYVSPTGGPIRSSTGMRQLVDRPAHEVERADTVIIPGGDLLPTTAADPDVLDSVACLIAAGSRVASICTGAFLLAAIGALDGRQATTHWAHTALLARAYPQIEVFPDRLFTRSGRFHTSAGVSAGIDLALSLVEADHGADLSREVARQLVVYLHRPGGQSQFSTLLTVAPSNHEAVRRAPDAIAADPAAALALDDLARIAGLSSRHLTRLFRTELGTTPARFVERVRIDLATAFLLRGESVAAAASRSGLRSPETLRRLFLARHGVPPSEYRKRFGSSLDERSSKLGQTRRRAGDTV